jgi:hypothetical protein
MRSSTNFPPSVVTNDRVVDVTLNNQTKTIAMGSTNKIHRCLCVIDGPAAAHRPESSGVVRLGLFDDALRQQCLLAMVRRRSDAGASGASAPAAAAGGVRSGSDGNQIPTIRGKPAFHGSNVDDVRNTGLNATK